MVGSRGFEPRSARSERAASADCATSRDGDHGRTRTATGQALDLLPLPDWATWPLVPLGGLEPPPLGLRARHAALTLQRGVELIPGIEPGRRPYQDRRLPLHQISSGANDGIRTRTSRLGRPVGDRYPTFALVRPTGIEPVPPRWQRGMHPPHPGRTVDRCRSPAHRDPSVFKDPARQSWWAARDSNPSAPLGENGVTARQRTIRSYRPNGDSARTRTRTHELWRLGCSVTPRCRSCSRLGPFEDTTSLRPGVGFPPRARPKQKKAF